MLEKYEQFGIEKFLFEYPGISTTPSSVLGIFLRGTFNFTAETDKRGTISDQYEIEILVPFNFPRSVPVVREIRGKIPKNGDFHVNPDGSLCLGSPLRLLSLVNSNPNLVAFAEKCLIPYFYAVSIKLNYGDDFMFGELDHGNVGALEDYSLLLGLEEDSQIIQAFQLMGLKKRVGNKKACPCGCGKRLVRIPVKVATCSGRKLPLHRHHPTC
ncbi:MULTISPECIES: hypothetical protein [unclassified Oceanispirochaeta]|uniref:hypothetical protein n=1 Tax=unclassified Oceanispirochaeta TaxID=2635722 RepID=UPI000E09A141|nr:MULTISPECIES: hypothetical protein [unclassified Oceanispirochaeta]MBF9016725.1 hypothetical protein [Oceanispirochaeta sp. M2]NPD71995.1 hypothetical protein [Oceanispirochaeta sp. M1]RDG32440.1 hypothetical protein DV872_07775 [Oceanispirochaeta sp. M1]